VPLLSNIPQGKTMTVTLKKLGSGFAALSLVIAVLSGCSRGNSATGESGDSGSSYPTDAKEFAHRYNKLAEPAYQIVSISPNRGFDVLELPKGSKIFAYRKGAYWLQPDYGWPGLRPPSLTDNEIIQVCAWMIRAAGPSISSVDATDVASKVTSNPSPIHAVEIIRGGVVVDGRSREPCDIAPTGL